MSEESIGGRGPLVVGVLPGQHPEVLQAARALGERLAIPLVFAYVDEASYLVEWDPARNAHRLSLHPEKDDADLAALRSELDAFIRSALMDSPLEWSLRFLAGDPARALGRLGADVGAFMIVVGTPEPGLGHRISEALNGSVASWLSHHQSLPVLLVPAAKHAGN